MQKTSKRRAPRSEYTSQSQLSFTEFETPFYNGLDPSSRWVVLSSQIPWDVLVTCSTNVTLQNLLAGQETFSGWSKGLSKWIYLFLS